MRNNDMKNEHKIKERDLLICHLLAKNKNKNNSIVTFSGESQQFCYRNPLWIREHQERVYYPRVKVIEVDFQKKNYDSFGKS